MGCSRDRWAEMDEEERQEREAVRAIGGVVTPQHYDNCDDADRCEALAPDVCVVLGGVA